MSAKYINVWQLAIGQCVYIKDPESNDEWTPAVCLDKTRIDRSSKSLKWYSGKRAWRKLINVGLVHLMLATGREMAVSPRVAGKPCSYETFSAERQRLSGDDMSIDLQS